MPPSAALTVCRTYSSYLLIADAGIVAVERRSEEERRQASTIALVVGGVVGPVLAALLTRVGMPGGPTRLYLRGRDLPPLAEMREVVTRWAADAPEELLSRPEWPRVEAHRPVTYYPRVCIASLRLSLWHGLRLELRREASPHVALPLAPWDRRRARRRLRDAGYPLVET